MCTISESSELIGSTSGNKEAKGHWTKRTEKL